MNSSNLILVEPKTRQSFSETKNHKPKKYIRPLQKWAALHPDQAFQLIHLLKKVSLISWYLWFTSGILNVYGQVPLDTCPLHSVSATPAELIGFTLFYMLISTRSAALRICILNSEFCTEQTGSQARKEKIITSVTFQNKKFHVDTGTQISKKETNTSSSANCGRKWSCDYHGNSSASRRQLSTVLRRGGFKTQPVGIAGWRSKTRSKP